MGIYTGPGMKDSTHPGLRKLVTVVVTIEENSKTAAGASRVSG